MPRWLLPLLAGVPAAAIGYWIVGAPPVVVFALSVLGLLPVAGLIGASTEQLAEHLGPRVGGLLNATFGNAAELIITAFAIREGLLTLAKASITGSIIGNLLLVFGGAVLAGGIKRGTLQYSARHASVDAAMMILAVSGLYLPATFALTAHDPDAVQKLSYLVAGILLISYFAYLGYTLLGAGAAAGASHDQVRRQPTIPVRRSAIVRPAGILALSTVGAAVASETLVGSVQSVSQSLGWSEFFIGVVVVAIVGNAAEHLTAVTMALKGHMSVSLAITAGSSTQIALFVAPVLVLLSLLLGHPMDLVFKPLELAVLGLSTAIFAYISLDGESNWLEGVQLLAIYCIAALAFFFFPAGA